VPYTFKHVLAPKQTTNIETPEESQSLQALGLMPNATLILVPVSKWTSAYESDGAGLLSRGVSAGYNVVSSGIGLMSDMLGNLLGRHDASPPSVQIGNSVAPSPSVAANVQTLGEQRPENQQFYNGNALNFEPNKDDEEKKGN